jgi:hypothetical protein
METDVVDPDRWMRRRVQDETLTKAMRHRWRGHVIDASQRVFLSPPSAFVPSGLPVYILRLDEGTDIPSLVGLAVSHRSRFWTAGLLIVLSTAHLRQQAKHIAKRVLCYI